MVEGVGKVEGFGKVLRMQGAREFDKMMIG